MEHLDYYPNNNPELLDFTPHGELECVVEEFINYKGNTAIWALQPSDTKRYTFRFNICLYKKAYADPIPVPISNNCFTMAD